ncbi:hypothetical protein [Haloprofundus halobius]|uniref:hypothetical protein n=1 Tax=Haloprofundus halobius TaxID=2876194 RepID=UPI001CC9A4B9|nr:hypothetical protein [Haloprofundus halobius]
MSNYATPVESENGRCPHFDAVDEKTLRRLFSKVAAVRSEDYDLFSFTHRPMEVYDGSDPRAERTVSEDHVYRQFSEEREGNFVVVIEGVVGTGKSELCAYLSHRLETEDDRPTLHIDKNDDLMTILSDRIPEFYEEHFGEELPGASEFKNLKSDIEHNPQTVANNATSGAILNLRRLDYEVETTADQENEIRDYVADKLVQLVQRGEYDRKVQFVGEKEFEQNDYLQIFEGDIQSSEAASAFDAELWREIRDRYDTASLDQVLERVGERFEDTRPVLVFEDFSIAAMEAKKLRNYMERDKTSDNWDFIIAGTHDSTEVLHTQTAGDRFEFYQTNTPNSNSVPFLTEQTAVDFVRPYLGYIKNHDESVRYDRDDDSFDLKSAPAGSICAGCGFCDESFRDLFPFNEPFLRRIYTSLEEDQQSPRELIMVVFEVLRDFYDGIIEVPSSADVLKPLRNTVSVADAVYDEAEEYADLAKWYGVEEDTVVVIDRKFVDAFGLSVDGLPDEIEVGSQEVRVNKTGGTNPPPEGCPNCHAPVSKFITESDGTIKCGECSEIISRGRSSLEIKVEEAKQEVDSWLEKPRKYPDTNMYIRRGLRDLLKDLTDDFRLYEGQPLRYNLSSEKAPYVYPDSNDAPQWDQILLNREDFQRSDLRQLVEFGVRRVEKPRSANYEKMRERIGTQLTGYAKRWRQRIFETQLDNENVLYKQHAQLNFSDFLLASYATLVLLDDPTKPVTAERLNERYQSDEDLSLDSDLKKALKGVVDKADYPHFSNAMEDAAYVESLVGEIFGVSASALDVPKVRRRLDRNPPYKVLQMLGRGYIQNIEARVRFETGHNVKDFADTMYDVRKVLDEVVKRGYDDETVDYVTSTVEGTDMDRVGEIYDSLRTYDGVDAEFREALGKVCRHSNEDVVAAGETARLAHELSSGDNFDQITAALASQKLSNLKVVTRFREVPFAGKGGSSGDSIGGLFQEVSSHYVE